VNPQGVQNGRDPVAFQGLVATGLEGSLGYTFPTVLVDHAMRNPSVPPGFWRGVNLNQNAIYMECFIDEIASATQQDPLALREQILRSADCVSLPSLLAWCAQAGIPVLYVHKLPGKKMTGMVVRDADRFAVVLSRKGTPSHLLFHLAHELGHIGHGHLKGNGFVVDEKIGDADRGDADEKEADAYAIRLINGKSVSYSASGTIRSGAALYRAALAVAQQERIDVGHIVLNYGNAQKAHALATQALKHIAGVPDGGTLVNTHFWQTSDTEAVSEDQLEFLQTALA
jgi:Zn-dependent peptidase ImmA (M78 family)